MTDTLISEWATAATLPPLLTVSEWADAHRVLPRSSSSKGGRWRTESTPYLRGIMDAILEPGVSTLALMKCAQSGGTEAVSNVIGYLMEHDPCAMLMVHPTGFGAETWSKNRFAEMIETTPALSAAIDRGKSTLLLKMFQGGSLQLGGANTPNTFAQSSVRCAIGDDVDRFPPVVGDEGDPADLLINRTTTFDDALNIFISTPTLKQGRIDTLFSRSDQRRYFLTCPWCGRSDYTTWNSPNHFRVAFEDRDIDTARLACPDEEHGGCGALMEDATRRTMVAEGDWRPTAIPEERGLVGFHLPAMLSTLGRVSLTSLVGKWLAARKKGKESTRVFINTQLAEGWEDRGARMDPNALLQRREDYGLEVEVPAQAVAITAGVDGQENRFEMTVTAWGPALERWVIDHRVIPGSPKLHDTRAQLLEALCRKYTHASGALLPIHATCIDSGYATDEIYEFVLAYQVRRIFATKGFAGKAGEPIVGKAAEKRTGKIQARPVRLYPINVDDAKTDVMSGLDLPRPNPGEIAPGYIHFPAHLDTIDDEYFAQLCAEHRETKYNKGGIATHTVWVLDRERNEALDCAVLCLAAFKLLNPNIRQMLEVLGAAVARPVPPPPAPGATPPAPAALPAGRRVSRSAYLGGQR